jgi:hypothetical protein
MGSKPFEIIPIVDYRTREALCGKRDYSSTEEDLIERFNDWAIQRGMPREILLDNGPMSMHPYSFRKPSASGESRCT